MNEGLNTPIYTLSSEALVATDINKHIANMLIVIGIRSNHAEKTRPNDNIPVVPVHSIDPNFTLFCILFHLFL